MDEYTIPISEERVDQDILEALPSMAGCSEIVTGAEQGEQLAGIERIETTQTLRKQGPAEVDQIQVHRQTLRIREVDHVDHFLEMDDQPVWLYKSRRLITLIMLIMYFYTSLDANLKSMASDDWRK